MRVGDLVSAGDAIAEVDHAPTSVAFLDPATDQVLSTPFEQGMVRAAGETLQVDMEPDAAELLELLRFAAAHAQPSSARDAGDAESSGGRSYSGLTIRDADPQARATLPVSALWTSDEGTMCVFTRDADLEPKRREVTGVTPSALPGVAEVGPELSGVEVVTRVSALPADVLNTC